MTSTRQNIVRLYRGDRSRAMVHLSGCRHDVAAQRKAAGQVGISRPDEPVDLLTLVAVHDTDAARIPEWSGDVASCIAGNDDLFRAVWDRLNPGVNLDSLLASAGQ
jgi:hypothetical protein